MLAPATALACYLLVVLGDTVRVTESGMGCRSWPLCNGNLGLTGVYQALLEQSHRYAAAVVTLLMIATFVALRRSAARDRLAYRATVFGLALIGAQVLLGAITVFAHNAGWTVALHLACAWLVLATVTVTAVRVLRPGEPDGGGSSALVAPIGVFLLSVSGMLVLHEGASRACPSWPLCLGSPAPLRLLLLQYAHRTLAFLAAVVLVFSAVALWRSAPARSPQRLAIGVVFTLLAATAALGGVVATNGASPSGQDLHLALASALWVSVVALTVLPPARVRAL